MYFLARHRGLRSLARFVAFVLLIAPPLRVFAVEAPRLVEKNGHIALFVEGRPFLMLGGQIHNSSAWPSLLPEVWESMAALHANTVEVPVYWEQIEPLPGKFDFSNVDQVVEGARSHGLHVILLWFGTWKNGNMHYVPEWVKTDTKRFPRVIRADGEPIDVLTALSRNTLEADRDAFVALMRHLKAIDGEQHTILMIQVENESGIVGSVRDFSPEANREFAGQVPSDLLALVHKPAGTWAQVFAGGADEMFQVYHQAKYMNEIAAAGKKEFAIPYYMNVWLAYPPAELPQRQLDAPGIGYPSGGPVQKMVDVWKKLAPSIDAIGPDLYSSDSRFYREMLKTYRRSDNPLWIPETGRDEAYSKFLFYALGEGAIGFSPFGMDQPWGITPGKVLGNGHANNFALLGPMEREIAQAEFEGKLRTAVEEPGQVDEEVDFGNWQATVAYGFPQPDGRRAPGTKDAHAAALVVQVGPDEFLVTGIDCSVIFHLPGNKPWMHSEFLRVEEGTFSDGAWTTRRLLNGDETDRGLQFHSGTELVRVKLNRF